MYFSHNECFHYKLLAYLSEINFYSMDYYLIKIISLLQINYGYVIVIYTKKL